MVPPNLSDTPNGLLLAIVGPTASGKSAMAMRIADALPVEIVSCDSVQVYRGFDIGTAKPTNEEREKTSHHLIDVADPTESFNAGLYVELADQAIAEIRARDKFPLLVGGTGLYLRALMHGLTPVGSVSDDVKEDLERRLRADGLPDLYRRLQEVDPTMAMQLPSADTQRILRALAVFETTGRRLSDLQAEHGFTSKRYRTCIVAMDLPREVLYERINTRVQTMLDRGLIAEVEGLLERGVPLDCKPMSVPGYKEIAAMLRGELELEEVLEGTRRSHRRYSKRQMTWFRSLLEVQWKSPEAVADVCETFARTVAA